MSIYDAAIRAIADDAVGAVDWNSTGGTTVVGLGSGRAAAAVARALVRLAGPAGSCRMVGVPTSLQIKIVVEEEAAAEKGKKSGGTCRLPLIEADQVGAIDIAFDGADQVDASGYLVKGGGGALLRENILFNLASRVVVVADRTKFVRRITRPVPVEVHRLARRLAQKKIEGLGGEPVLRMQGSGYPVFTENGNIILDCNFGTVEDPRGLTGSIKQIPGVVESGIFSRRPDLIYKAGANGRFKAVPVSGSSREGGEVDLYTEDDPDFIA